MIQLWQEMKLKVTTATKICRVEPEVPKHDKQDSQSLHCYWRVNEIAEEFQDLQQIDEVDVLLALVLLDASKPENSDQSFSKIAQEKLIGEEADVDCINTEVANSGRQRNEEKLAEM